ncbi:MAG: methyltransferase domain-containing protein [Phenylobacterium sp.]|uniref:class I SAM-dependent methyltransferase n=1 Tax=Phenylobacterium sp. TaxID=1871053 RepID=UPI0027329056|nr:methyltransferase domain-containing protein [Phenylobacterium sp.]MDP3174716.1 methyltransferase domain-containing protein [Phenylobacterium sp.]
MRRAADAYDCAACGRSYPVLFGIADFRLRGDRYLTIDAEREKAGRLHAFAAGTDFAGLVRRYYEITDDITPRQAESYLHALLDAPGRAQAGLSALEPPQGLLLDAGCGAGGALVAAADRWKGLVGLDVALRWLVICAKRLEEAGVEALLVCAEIEAAPFADHQFDAVLAADLLEHVRALTPALEGLADQLSPQGRLWLSAANSHWIGPHPSTGLWAAHARSAASRARKGSGGVDPLRHVLPLNAARVARAARDAGLDVISTRAKRLNRAQIAGARGLARPAAGLYAAASQTPGVSQALAAVGPMFEILARPAAGRPMGARP